MTRAYYNDQDLVRILFAPLEQHAVSRVGRLRGYGNAIVPQVGAVFVEALLSA